MKISFSKLITSGSILSVPGLLSIFVSLISIPIHLNIAGTENYGNYIIFHFILAITTTLNFGIGKSVAVSINNFPKKNKEIAFQGLKYTFVIILFIFLLFFIWILFNRVVFDNFLKLNSNLMYLIFGTTITIFYVSLEGIFQGNEKFKSLSFYNFNFYSLAVSLPSFLLMYAQNLTFENLILISIIIKFTTILIMFLTVLNGQLILKSSSKILINNLKKNSKWITLNNVLIQFYDLFDKYLIKIFIGPIALATYSIPQQLTGKLSIFSKGFCAFLLPTMARKKKNNSDFILTIKIFLKIIPVIIFLIFPFYSFFLNFWLGNEFNQEILDLTKIFSLCIIFACASHILVTKFEASKTLKRNLKLEFILMPFFLAILYFLISNSYSLTHIAIAILIKELILLFLRLNLLKKELKRVYIYYIYSFVFIALLYFSFNNQNLFYLTEVLLILSIFKNDY
jgi:O-antigen/teichoic acid export membrane protein